MNISSKVKKRVVLPTRPEPPTVDQILEDMSQAGPDDPVFRILDQSGQDSPRPGGGGGVEEGGGGLGVQVEQRFQQLRRFLELQQCLQEAREQLLDQRGALQAAGDQLERDVTEVKGQTL